MNYFKIKDKNDLDYRAEFANHVCKLIYDKHNGNLNKACLNEAKQSLQYFDDMVRNFYKVIDNQVPLFALVNLKTNDCETYDVTQEEFDSFIEESVKYCHIYYK